MISSADRPLPGISDSSHPQTLATARAVLGVGDVAVAGELVALVALLATALAVALPGDGGDATAGLAELAGGEAEVDGGEHVVDALGVLFDATGVQQHAGCGGPPPFGGLFDARRGQPADLRGPRWGHVGHGGGGLVEADGVRVDEVVVEPVVADQLVQHGPEQGGVGAWPYGEEQVRGAGHRHDAGRCTMSLAPRSRACHT